MSECSGANSCPGIYPMESGDFMVVGLDAIESVDALPEAEVSELESAVIVPRDAMQAFVARYVGYLP